jgi:four helix bundle protein
MGESIQSFHELRVYQAACALDEAIFHETKTWPREEMYSLIDQVRRSSRSIGANIAESWAKRRYPAHFVSKLSDADAELQETMHWLGRARTYGYLANDRCSELEADCRAIGGMLGKMIREPDGFLLKI